MLVIKFMIMAVAALVDKVFQTELRPAPRVQPRIVIGPRFYNIGHPPGPVILEGSRNLDVS